MGANSIEFESISKKANEEISHATGEKESESLSKGRVHQDKEESIESGEQQPPTELGNL